MPWTAIIALLLPIIINCIGKGASDEVIRKRIKNPRQRHIRMMRRKLNRKVRQDEPDLRKRDCKVRVDTLLDVTLDRGRNATDAEIRDVIDEAHGRKKVASTVWRTTP